jgi:hypothetical protein
MLSGSAMWTQIDIFGLNAGSARLARLGMADISRTSNTQGFFYATSQTLEMVNFSAVTS